MNRFTTTKTTFEAWRFFEPDNSGVWQAPRDPWPEYLHRDHKGYYVLNPDRSRQYLEQGDFVLPYLDEDRGLGAYRVPSDTFNFIFDEIKDVFADEIKGRQLSGVVSPGSIELIQVYVLGEKGPGGAHHNYRIVMERPEDLDVLDVHFQEGTLKDVGVNGITMESLLSIILDLLQEFQAGEFGCTENAIAIGHVKEARIALHRRTEDRIKRAVEGTSEK